MYKYKLYILRQRFFTCYDIKMFDSAYLTIPAI